MPTIPPASRHRSARAVVVGLLAGAALLVPAAIAVADSPVTPAKASAQRAKYYVHLSGGDTVILDPAHTRAEIGANRSYGKLTPTAPGPVTSTYSGWKYRLFLPAGRPDLNPPYVEARFRGELMQKVYFTPSGKRPPSAAKSAGEFTGEGEKEGEKGSIPEGPVETGAAPITDRTAKDGSTESSAESSAGQANSHALLYASGGAATVVGALGFGALRRGQGSK
ncbi:hypothetical protein ACFQVC_35080 [Streptomyces monticola]|uniref:Gram-positive cocci surface proteins LPxTG domain-containing protein n=1 Tax=Streptomyces monticola TaxID=2666263 RepID=A0ABW2JUG1_9ACTN